MASIEQVLKLLESIDDERYVVVYDDYESFRKIYSQHAKKRIENNEVVICCSTMKIRTGLGPRSPWPESTSRSSRAAAF
jgi:hypothetical protein